MLRCARCAVGAGQMFYSKDGECGNGRVREMCQGRWNILGYHFIKRQPSLNGTSIFENKEGPGRRDYQTIIRQAEEYRRARGSLEA